MFDFIRRKKIKSPENQKKEEILRSGREQFKKLSQIGVNFPIISWRA